MPVYESLARLDSKKRWLLGGLIIALIFGLFFYFVFLANQARLRELGEELEQKRAQIARDRTFEKDLPRLREETKALKQQLSYALVLIPQRKEIPSLLANVANLGAAAGLEFGLFRPEPEVEQEFYTEVPIRLRLRGGFHSVATFFDRISKLNRIVTVTDVRISEAAFEDNEVMVTVDCLSTTYRFTGGVEGEQGN